MLLLSDSSDIHRETPFHEAVEIIESFGFRRFLHRAFYSRYGEEEHLFYWLDGILLMADSHNGMVNTASVHFEYLFNQDAPEQVRSEFRTGVSGRPSRERIIGSYYINQHGIKRLAKMMDYGYFLSEWTERNFFYVLNYSDPNQGYEQDEAERGVLARFPDKILKAVRRK